LKEGSERDLLFVRRHFKS